MKILVVEDESYSLQSLIKQIKAQDTGGRFEIVPAANGREAFEKFSAGEFPLVISDIKMPHMDGLELLRLVLDAKPGTRVIMVSGHAEFEYAQQAVNLGAAGYLLKPVDDEKLAGVLGKFLQQNQKRTREGMVDESDSLTRYIHRAIFSDASLPDFINDSIFARMFPRFLFLYLFFPAGDFSNRHFFSLVARQEALLAVDRFRLLGISRRGWGLVLQQDDATRGWVHSLHTLLLAEGYNHYLGISEGFGTATALRTAYLQARGAVKSRLFFPGRVLYHGDIAASSGPAAPPDAKQLEVLRLHLDRGDAEAAERLARTLVEGCFARCDPEGLALLLEALSAPARPLGGANGGGKTEEEKPLSLLDYGTREALDAAIAARLAAVAGQCSAAGTAVAERTVYAVLEYIKRNYDKDISLKDLADQVFFMNSAYLSSRITEVTGQSFSAHLQSVRLEKARALLETTALSITEVATLTGHNDTSRFIQNFKKATGHTPKQYRGLFSKNKETQLGEDTK